MYSQLDLPVVEAMATPRAPDYLPVQTMLREKQAQRHKASVDTVNMATPLRDVMVKLASSAHHQLVCVSDGAANQQTVLGVITIDDFFSWLLKITVPVASDGAGAGAEQATPVGS
jgi:CBS-domain-containing membrane protein